MEKSRFINEVCHISEEYTAIGWKNRKLLSVNISTTKRCCGKVEDFPCLYTRETFSNYPLAKPHCVNNVTLSRRSRDTTWPSDWFNSATFVKLVFNKILLQNVFKPFWNRWIRLRCKANWRQVSLVESDFLKRRGEGLFGNVARAYRSCHLKKIMT